MAAPSRYPRESQEYVKLAATVNGAVVASFKYAVTQGGDSRPPATSDPAWGTPATVDGLPAFLLDGARDAGRYRVWVKVDSGAEHIVIDAGAIDLT